MKLSGVLTAGGLIQAAFESTGAGPRWPGFEGLRYFFAFGDSYTAIEFNSWKPIPTDSNPMGVPYPGLPFSPRHCSSTLTPYLLGTTWIDGANYAGYMTMRYNQSRLLTWDYAVGGSTVQGVKKQVLEDFLSMRGAGHKPWYAPWTASDSLFACFVGINDLNTHAPINPSISELFDLYETFCLSTSLLLLIVLHLALSPRSGYVLVRGMQLEGSREPPKLSKPGGLMSRFSTMMLGGA
ncbi:unnamed protein product [Rhizoctonia solani]|uniref:Uncharacterized protein n=1 Tax=Rhizoctonia solani TaxID=456999 RepID=A0A8H3HP44_9AGAM|nr:unnamed protein product [Rhizoctonia solani]